MILTDRETSSTETDSDKLPIVVTTGQTPVHSSSSIEPSTGVSPISDHLNLSNSSADTQEGSNNDDYNAKSNASHSSMASTYTDLSSFGQASITETQVSYEQVCYCCFFLEFL